MGLFSTIAAAGINNALASQREQNARQSNYIYGELSANNADKRTRELYNDLYSPAAQMKQLKEAGLSPSIYASGGLAGKSGANGAQGNGASGISPNVFGIDPLTASQIELNKSQANKNNAETKKTDLETTFTDLQNQHAQLDLEIKKAQKEGNIQLVYKQVEQMEANIALAWKELEGKELEQEWIKENWNTNKKQLEENLNKTITEIAVLKVKEAAEKQNIKVNEEQIKLIKTKVEEINKRLILDAEKNEISKQSVQNQKTYWNKQCNIALEQLNLELSKIENGRLEFNQELEHKYYQTNMSLYQSGFLTEIFGGSLYDVLGGTKNNGSLIHDTNYKYPRYTGFK